LEQVIKAKSGKKKGTSDRLNRNSELFLTVVDAIQEKKGENIVALDLKNIEEAVADFFVVCEGRSNVNVRAIADYVVEKTKEVCDERPFHVEYGDHWTLIDFVNIVVHVFQREQRVFYNLENLWADAPITEI
jgi:ribosome-associated protein